MRLIIKTCGRSDLDFMPTDIISVCVIGNDICSLMTINYVFCFIKKVDTIADSIH